MTKPAQENNERKQESKPKFSYSEECARLDCFYAIRKGGEKYKEAMKDCIKNYIGFYEGRQ